LALAAGSGHFCVENFGEIMGTGDGVVVVISMEMLLRVVEGNGILGVR